MSKIQNPDKQKPEISQLHRLAGQLGGVEKMMQNQAKLTEIIQQLEAVRGSIESLELKLLQQMSKNIKDKQLGQCLKYLLKS